MSIYVVLDSLKDRGHELRFAVLFYFINRTELVLFIRYSHQEKCFDLFVTISLEKIRINTHDVNVNCMTQTV